MAFFEGFGWDSRTGNSSGGHPPKVLQIKSAVREIPCSDEMIMILARQIHPKKFTMKRGIQSNLQNGGIVFSCVNYNFTRCIETPQFPSMKVSCIE